MDTTATRVGNYSAYTRNLAAVSLRVSYGLVSSGAILDWPDSFAAETAR